MDFTQKFRSFIEKYYYSELLKAVKKGESSLMISFGKLAKFDLDLAEKLLNDPLKTLEFAEEALREFDLPEIAVLKIRISDLPKSLTVKIRNLRSDHLGKLIAIEGLIRQASDIRPKMTLATFECPGCGTQLTIEQRGEIFKEPAKCACGRKSKFRLVDKKMVDVQRLMVEEAPESLEGGEQPKKMAVFLSEDLLDPKLEKHRFPGNKIKVIGVVKEVAIPTRIGGQSTRFDLIVDANSVSTVETEFEEIEISKKDEEAIKDLASKPDIYRKLINSVVPSIYGYDRIKEALILQLFGGVRKKREDGTSVRGDLHVFLIGDPGCLVGDERIFLGNGAIVKVKDIGKEHLEKINVQVLTGEGGAKRDTATVFHWYKNQPIIEIITESGKSIKGTFNHPLRCISKKEGKVIRAWKRLDEFKVGDKVAVVTGVPCTIKKYIPTNFKLSQRHFGPKFKGKLPETVTPDLASLFGYLTGDGWMRKYEVGFVVAEPEKDILEPLLTMCNSLFGVKPSISKVLKSGRTVPLYYACIYSDDIASCLKFVREKRIPNLIFQSGNEVAAAFLRWLYEADGCVFDKGRGRRSISLKSKNIELLRDVQILLLRFKIHSRIIEDSLMIRRGKEIIKFAKKIGFISNKKKLIIEESARNAKSYGRFRSQRSERIVKIIHHDAEDVFDIEVPNSRRFIANGVISHNTGKSEILKYISTLAPKAKYVSGKGATSAGLTATVVKDEFLRGWALEAGALVLANRGVACLDELDKMGKEDRGAMHEALEQQSVTISKANIQATLRAETSVLAAANPKFGRFDPYEPIVNQIDLPSTLINRFDLIFPIRDLPDVKFDEKIARHMLELQKDIESKKPEIEPELLRKYIAYAKQNCYPKLTPSAFEELKNFYVNLRGIGATEAGEIKAVPISARQLQGLVRLAEASAKVRLSDKVTKKDAERAIELLRDYMKSVGTDPETGKLDIDRITTGVTATQRSRIAIVRKIIEELEGRIGKNIPVFEVLKAAEEEGLERSKVDEILEELKKKGDIFEPKAGLIQKIG